MTYYEVAKDLFTVNDYCFNNPYCLAHCISADFAMAGGIALGFNEHFNMRNRLIKKYVDKTKDFKKLGPVMIPEKCFTEKEPHQAFLVYNLITKCYVWDRPTYNTLRVTLVDMKNHMQDLGLTRLASPKIGCGIDGLDWETVKAMIQEVFQNTNIEVLVCIPEERN